VVTVLLAAWLFGERLTPVTLLGGVLILAAVIVLTRAELASSEKGIVNMEQKI
jgi:drug/metabolite transporter (DMT)-like permease